MSKTVEIYTLDYCPYCMKAKIFLNEHKVDFKEISCEDKEEFWRDELAKKYNLQNSVTFPQIIIDGQNIGGYTDMVDKFERGEINFE